MVETSRELMARSNRLVHVMKSRDCNTRHLAEFRTDQLPLGETLQADASGENSMKLAFRESDPLWPLAERGIARSRTDVRQTEVAA